MITTIKKQKKTTKIIIMINPHGLEIPGGNWHGIFCPLAVRLKCFRITKWSPEVKTYHIVRRLGKQGTRPPRESNQPGVENCTTGLATSLEKYSAGNHAQGDLPAGPSRVTGKRQKTIMEQRGL